MNKTDNISRDAKILVDSSRDSIVNNLLSSVRSGDLAINEDTLKKVLNIVNLSVDEGYQKALHVFQNTIKKYAE